MFLPAKTDVLEQESIRMRKKGMGGGVSLEAGITGKNNLEGKTWGMLA